MLNEQLVQPRVPIRTQHLVAALLEGASTRIYRVSEHRSERLPGVQKKCQPLTIVPEARVHQACACLRPVGSKE